MCFLWTYTIVLTKTVEVFPYLFVETRKLCSRLTPASVRVDKELAASTEWLDVDDGTFLVVTEFKTEHVFLMVSWGV